MFPCLCLGFLVSHVFTSRVSRCPHVLMPGVVLCLHVLFVGLLSVCMSSCQRWHGVPISPHHGGACARLGVLWGGCQEQAPCAGQESAGGARIRF